MYFKYFSIVIRSTYGEPFIKFSSFFIQCISFYWHLYNKKLKNLYIGTTETDDIGIIRVFSID